MEIFILLVVAITGIIALSEAYYERDWPRDTGKYFMISVSALLLWIFFVG
jgi:hypothetical protein